MAGERAGGSAAASDHVVPGTQPALLADETAVQESLAQDGVDAAAPDEGASSGPTRDPALHAYLGLTGHIAGRTVLPEEQRLTMMVLLLDGVVLFPGELLALTRQPDAVMRQLECFASTSHQGPKHVGILSTEAIDAGQRMVGTTAEVCSGSVLAGDEEGLDGLGFVLRGRQRFELMEEAHEWIIPGASVVILPDRVSGNAATPRRRECASGPWACRLVRRLADVHWLAASVRREVTRHWSHLLWRAEPGGPAVEASMPGEPLRLSHWLGANLPIDSGERQALLACPTAGERLLRQLRLMVAMRGAPLRCQYCSAVVAEADQEFSFSSEGAVGTYVNPHGVVHQVVTVRDAAVRIHLAQLLREVPPPSTEMSWFPGYAWTIVHCTCGNHLGWQFHWTGRLPHTPQSFFGFRRAEVSRAAPLQ